MKKKVIKLKSSGKQSRDFVWINDLGQALDILFKAPSEKVGGEIFNVGGENSVSIMELAELVCQEFKRRYKAGIEIEIPEKENANNEIVNDLKVSIDKIKALGYSPRNKMKEEINNIFDLLE